MKKLDYSVVKGSTILSGSLTMEIIKSNLVHGHIRTISSYGTCHREWRN